MSYNIRLILNTTITQCVRSQVTHILSQCSEHIAIHTVPMTHYSYQICIYASVLIKLKLVIYGLKTIILHKKSSMINKDIYI